MGQVWAKKHLEIVNKIEKITQMLKNFYKKGLQIGNFMYNSKRVEILRGVMMIRKESLQKSLFSLKQNIEKFLNKVKEKDTKAISTLLSVVMILSSFGFITKYYTLGYDVYYGDVNVGVSNSKKEAMIAYDEAKTDVEFFAEEKLEHELGFVMTIAPIEKIADSDIYRGIVEASQGLEDCYSIEVNNTSVVKVKTRADAEKTLAGYLLSFGYSDAVIATGYTIAPEKDIVTEILSVEEAIGTLKTSGVIAVTYSIAQTEIEIPFAETIVEDSSVAEGCEVCTQEGVVGKGVNKTVMRFENGTYTSESVVEIVEEPVEEITCIGTGKMVGLEENSLPWPTKGTFTSEYGRRWGRNHNGIDIAAPKGTAIYAPCSGVVIYADVKNGYGNYVMIDHGEGYVTTYAHMNKSHVYEGQIVTKGDLIGEVGVTGRVTGSHLHFEILLNDKYVNPMKYIAG